MDNIVRDGAIQQQKEQRPPTLLSRHSVPGREAERGDQPDIADQVAQARVAGEDVIPTHNDRDGPAHDEHDPEPKGNPAELLAIACVKACRGCGQHWRSPAYVILNERQRLRRNATSPSRSPGSWPGCLS